MKPRRRQPFDPSKPAYDRRTKDKLQNVQLVPQEVDDPMGLEPGDKIIVMRSIRRDPLGALHSRGDIDEAQYRGGRAFQRDFEAAQQKLRAADPSNPYVDCSRVDRTDSRRVSDALNGLADAHRELGQDGSGYMHDFLIDGCTMSAIAAKRGLTGKQWENYFGMRVRECLHRLAFSYGFAKEKTGRVRIGSK